VNASARLETDDMWSRIGTRVRALFPVVSILVAVFTSNGAARQPSIRVMSAGATAAAHLALAPAFERLTGRSVETLATSTGLGADSIASRVRRGEAVDVLLLARSALDELAKEGLVRPSSRVDLAESRIGLAVRRGAAKPDISTVDALKRALLQAKSVAYSAQVSGVYLTTELFPRLGIAAEMAAKSQRIERERVGAVVARGEAEIGFQQISELLEVPGVDLVGALPADVQRVTTFSAGITQRSPQAEAAQRYIAFLQSVQGVQTMKERGLEPITPRR
jgi:molybdate transport system substrate-binding protein